MVCGASGLSLLCPSSEYGRWTVILRQSPTVECLLRREGCRAVAKPGHQPDNWWAPTRLVVGLGATLLERSSGSPPIECFSW